MDNLDGLEFVLLKVFEFVDFGEATLSKEAAFNVALNDNLSSVVDMLLLNDSLIFSLLGYRVVVLMLHFYHLDFLLYSI